MLVVGGGDQELTAIPRKPASIMASLAVLVLGWRWPHWCARTHAGLNPLIPGVAPGSSGVAGAATEDGIEKKFDHII
jgi:hypothetical protein